MRRPIQHADELEQAQAQPPPFMLLVFHSPTSEKSGQALERLGAIAKDNPDVPMYSIDVKAVPQIHPQYGVVSVPTVIVL